MRVDKAIVYRLSSPANGSAPPYSPALAGSPAQSQRASAPRRATPRAARGDRIKTGESYAKDSSTASESLSRLPRQQHILVSTSDQRMALRSYPLILNVHFSQVYDTPK